MGEHSIHSFHIPVMGLAYTIDSPIRVAHLGISSVISIMDDDLIEKMNAHYSAKFGFPHVLSDKNNPECRAQRITSYLNLVNTIVNANTAVFKQKLTSSADALRDFLSMLPTRSGFRQNIEKLARGTNAKALADYIFEHLRPGSIDVNIMTKVDRENHDKNGQLPIEFNDAHAALRGFANSTLESSVVLSAGMHPRLYSYFEQFADFFPDADQRLKKKITIKVSDFRSAQIQGLYLAKKGLWVSEFRIESGLNCGGHAFATDGHLMGPILEEFKQKKQELTASMHETLCKALTQKNIAVPQREMPVLISVQGGVGTAGEHEFLLDHYNVDSVGWGSPFLLVPEATAVDQATRQLLAGAGESDLYTSDISPLGVPFNTVRGTSSEKLRHKRIRDEKPGSSCPKKYLALSKEYGNEGICTAARKYQLRKLSELEQTGVEDLEARKAEVLEKSCLCVGLSNSALIENDIKIKGDNSVVICPGPNIAYFDREYSLGEMVRHIYGGTSVIAGVCRPNLFVKELKMYVEYLKAESCKSGRAAYVAKMKDNLLAGIAYYKKLFNEFPVFTGQCESDISGIYELDQAVLRVDCQPV